MLSREYLFLTTTCPDHKSTCAKHVTPYLFQPRDVILSQDTQEKSHVQNEPFLCKQYREIYVSNIVKMTHQFIKEKNNIAPSITFDESQISARFHLVDVTKTVPRII